MLKVDRGFTIKEDIAFIMESEGINDVEFSERTKVSRGTLDEIVRTGKTTDTVLEKIYSYAYQNRYRINMAKEELVKEMGPNALFHGSRQGLTEITAGGSRDNCDFGPGFYLGETYDQALAFVYEVKKSSVYSFGYSLEGLKVKRFDCSMDWMLAICYYRGTLKTYSKDKNVRGIIDEIEASDVIIAPIADNRMFYIMAQFTDGEINADVALHSLSASRLGNQYIFRTEKALQKLTPIERYYLCGPEREDCRKKMNDRGNEIDTKLKLAKREFKTGLYIEELFK